MDRLFFKDQSGFSLVEIVCVVIILGILSSIGAVSFRRFASSAIASGCKQQVSSYQKAAILFYTQNNYIPSIQELEKYGLVTLLACKYDNPKDCRHSAPINATSRLIGGAGNVNTYWPSPNGHCKIQYRSYGQFLQQWATPHHNSGFQNWAVSACFNSWTGAKKVSSFKYSVSSYTLHNQFC